MHKNNINSFNIKYRIISFDNNVKTLEPVVNNKDFLRQVSVVSSIDLNVKGISKESTLLKGHQAARSYAYDLTKPFLV